MNKPLRREKNVLHHYDAGDIVLGLNPSMTGNCSGLGGDCSELYGDCTNLSGNCTGLRGNLDKIPMESRPCDINDWVEEDNDD